MISVTSIEEIVKYQQELLNHQRNQKLIQQETIKLLNSLNKNITFMLDRLDEFANKTNLKLDVPNTTTQVDSYINFTPQIVNDQSQTVTSTTTIPTQQLIIIQQDQLNNMTATTTNNKTKLNKIKNSKSNNSNSQRSISISKLLDTTNTTVSRPGTSDESIDEDISFEETTDDEEKETIQVKKKPRTTILELTNNMHQATKANAKETEESNNQQRFFNKYVRESVEKKLGKDFLLLHEIQEISPEVMEEIRCEALKAYPPVNIRPRRAWHLAKASLRCRRRSLRRQKEKQILSSSVDNTATTSTTVTTTSNPTIVDLLSSNCTDETLNETTKTIIKITPI